MSFVGGVLSAGLNYVFIYLLDMGIGGAAIATSLGWVMPAVVGLVYFAFNRSGKLFLVRPKLDFGALGRSCVNGASEMVAMLSVSITTVLMNNILMYLDDGGPTAVGASAIMFGGMQIFAALFMGYASGVAPIISYNYGKGDNVYLKRAFRNSLRLIGLLAIMAFGLAWVSVDGLLWIYSVPVYSPQHEMVQNGYLFIISAFLLMGFNGFGTMFFTALNNGIVSSIMSLFNGFIFYVALLYPLAHFFQINGVWAAIPAAEALQIFVTLFFIIKMRKRYGYA
jgi:Na+-driven multidrug efflux pump